MVGQIEARCCARLGDIVVRRDEPSFIVLDAADVDFGSSVFRLCDLVAGQSFGLCY